MSYFAPPAQPGEPQQPSTQDAAAAADSPAATATPEQALPAPADTTAAAPVAAATVASADASAEQAASDQAARSSFAAAYDAPVPTGVYAYALPEPPRKRVSLVRPRTIATIAASSLLLGLAGGIGGAAAWDQWGPNDGGSTLPQSSSIDAQPVEAGSVAAVVQAVLPGVVKIESFTGGLAESSGSGLVIRADGYVLTNNHVIDGSDGKVQVLLSDGSVEEATIVGTSVQYDLAVLKIDREGLTPLVLGDSDAAIVGDPVIAIGSPLGLDSTVTTGIVSALERPVTTGTSGEQSFMAAIQTDAAINPGNSGGPLLNASGEVIGINSAVAALPGATQATGAGSVGLGFAIPSNVARRVAEEIIATGKAEVPVIGALLDDTYEGRGVRISDSSQLDGSPGVVAGSPADKAGLKEGEIIVAVDGRPVADADAAIVRIRSHAPGDEVTLTVLRDEKEQDITVTLSSLSQTDYGDATAVPEPTQ